jgi:hypothetical protein
MPSPIQWNAAIGRRIGSVGIRRWIQSEEGLRLLINKELF